MRTADPSADRRRSTAIFVTVEVPSAGGISSRRPRGDAFLDYFHFSHGPTSTNARYCSDNCAREIAVCHSQCLASVATYITTCTGGTSVCSRRRLHRGNRELRPGTHARTGANVAFCPGTFHGCALIVQFSYYCSVITFIALTV